MSYIVLQNNRFINSEVLVVFMANREQYTISFHIDEADRIKAVAKQSGETMSGYVRRCMLEIVKEEESQK